MVLARLRKDAGYSQERLAEALDVNRSYVSMVETGASKPSWRFLAAFADALRVPVQELLQSAGLVPDTAALENDIARLVAANPAFAGIFEFAREHPEKLREVLDYAHWITRGAPEEEEVEETRAAPKPRRRTAETDS